MNKEHGQVSLLDRLCADALAGQAAILDAQLKRGIPLVSQDEKGNLIQKNPDGTITPYDKKQWENFRKSDDPERQQRAYDVAEARASNELEGYTQSEYGKELSQRYIDGEITIDDQIRLLDEHYGIKR